MNMENALDGNLIKGVTGGNGSRAVIKNRVMEAQREADEIVAGARREAESIRDNARRDAENMREEAHREGLQRSLAEFEQLLADARELRLNALQTTERDLLSLSVKIAGKILRRELDSNDRAIVDIVAAALENARQRETIIVHVNPADHAMVSTHRENFPSSQRTKVLDFVSDPSVPAGGCVIETEVGQIDARLETQLNVIESALLNKSDEGVSG